MANETKGVIDRRLFLKGAALFGAVAATGTVTGCDSGTDGEIAEDETTATQETAKRHTWLGEAPVIDESQIVDTITADIVIVGGGNAGLSCACAAADEGITAVVIEAQDEESMTYWGLHDIATLNSEWALAHGAQHCDVTEFVNEWQKRSHNRTDPRIIKRYAENSGELLDWLMSKLDQEYIDAATLEYVGGNVEYYENGGEINSFKCWQLCTRVPNASEAFPSLIAEAESKGATWYWGHKGVVLSQESDGMVTGVIAQNKDGEYIKFVGEKATVLSAGDYGADPEMFIDLHDEVRDLFEARGLSTEEVTTFWGRDGSGARMGIWAGGAMEPGPRTCISPNVMFMSDVYKTNELRWGASWNGAANPEGTSWFCVRESDGKRFMDEGFMGIFGQVNRVQRMEIGKYYFFWDNKWPEYLSRQAPEHFMPSSDPVSIQSKQEILDGWYAAGAAGDSWESTDDSSSSDGTTCCWAADTLDELMDYMGITGDLKTTILAEIEKYNGFCATGKDTDFAKDPQLLMSIDEPPFYGMYSVSEQPMTGQLCLGGLLVDDQLRVLKNCADPIPNLYAVGNNAGMRFSIQYSTPSAGLSIGSAMTLGRQLGKQLVIL